MALSHPSLRVKDSAFSHTTDNVTMFLEILNLEGHPNHITGSRVKAILLNGRLCLLVKLHRWRVCNQRGYPM